MVLSWHAHLPGAPELRAAHDEHPVVPVDVVAVEAHRLSDPHAGHRQQPDAGSRTWPPAAAGVSVRAAAISAAMSVSEYRYGGAGGAGRGEQASGRDLGRGVERVQVAGRSRGPRSAGAASQIGLAFCGQGRPGQRPVRR